MSPRALAETSSRCCSTRLQPGDRAAGVARRLLSSLSQPISARGHEFVVHASVGLAFSSPGIEPDHLLRDADLAMYAAKRDGGHRVTVFTNEMLVRAESRIELVQDMPDALARSDFELRFQPIIDLADGGVEAVEALVRWRHPSRGLLKPDAFIASAEQMGMIDEIGHWVLDQSCRLIAHELPAGAGKPRVTVNVSPIQLREPRFASDVIACVGRHGIAPERLMLEVTESIAIEENARTHGNLSALHEFGVLLALDDFGAGYSSLSYLAQLPIDLLKLDRSLGAEIDRDPSQERLVAGVVGLANSLGLPVVVEGIERAGQLERILDMRRRIRPGLCARRADEPQSADRLVGGPPRQGRRGRLRIEQRQLRAELAQSPAHRLRASDGLAEDGASQLRRRSPRAEAVPADSRVRLLDSREARARSEAGRTRCGHCPSFRRRRCVRRFGPGRHRPAGWVTRDGRRSSRAWSPARRSSRSGRRARRCSPRPEHDRHAPPAAACRRPRARSWPSCTRPPERGSPKRSP